MGSGTLELPSYSTLTLGAVPKPLKTVPSIGTPGA